MRRRTFIVLLGGAITAGLSLAARSQQTARRVALLLPSRERDAEYQARLQVLWQALQRLGWTAGQTVQFEVRWGDGSRERIEALAPELVSLAPDLVISDGSIATAAMKRATSSIPVVFVMVNEPVTQGFVASLAKPGGNLTGFTNVDFSVIGKAVELLKTMVPTLNRVALMYNSDAYPIYDRYLHAWQSERRGQVEIVSASVRSVAEIEPAVDALAGVPGSGVAVLADGGFTIANRATIQSALDRHRLPSIGPYRRFAQEGALMSYGPDELDIFRRAADYVDRILKGAKPADLPVQQPTKFDLVVNRRTAKALGIEIPPMLLAQADEVME